MSLTAGVQHIGLAVSNLEASAAFFTKLLGWEEVKRREDYPAIFVKDEALMLTLWKTQTEAPVSFDRKKNVGLHHLALRVNSKADLYRILDILKANQIEIEFEPTLIREGPSMHMMCYEPSGIRVEFYCSDERNG
ncbi:VOC family protein [Yokenella regensburgei]|uniref:VOC family protein n=1 Tax=Yokenella regensburgei TaxID=158877 RepID=UPI003F1633BB